MPEDNTNDVYDTLKKSHREITSQTYKDVYDSLIKSHHEMVSKMYEDAIDPILEKMYQDDEWFDDNSNFSFYADQIKDSLKKIRTVLLSGNKRG